MKRRCMVMACKKKSKYEYNGIYYCSEHNPSELNMKRKKQKEVEYLLKDMRKVKFIEPKEERNDNKEM